MERKKRFVFCNSIKTTRGHVFNVNFRQNFQSIHQIDVPYRTGTQNLRRRDVCATEKELHHHFQLKKLEEFGIPSSGAPESQS